MRASIVIPSLNSPILDQVLAVVLSQDEIETASPVTSVGGHNPHLFHHNRCLG